MSDQPAVLAIIPARGGSKGLPNKNILPLAGKPLIAYSIEAGLEAKSITRVLVTTDSPEIAKVAESFGAEVPFLRPAELAKDDTPTMPVLQHALEVLKKKEGFQPDLVVLLQPTSPLRTKEDIDGAVNVLYRLDADLVTSVCRVKHHPYWMLKVENERATPFFPNGFVSRRQELPNVFALNGAVYVYKKEQVTQPKPTDQIRQGVWIMDVDRSIDIDTWFDFKVAETWLNMHGR
ncbi:hypothetical protein DNHGIG_10400 [Collibacillus ludicampi]|uniref:Acylneuraminate cytidylyltransferase family protein n=1 Tax=Collibacillus ludicampi TaxID=2771369 RepID=A0AAV4LCP3_9BACL|nr:acylneuraminate cytidylyltransferase family protein [Collibacillus ludicampi]GIM45491.1 hypothetical protein DNHGIG_10400 [Collibacillus ludicampi]